MAMIMIKLKAAMAGIVFAAAIAAVPLVMQYQENVKLKQEIQDLREQTAQVKELERIQGENAQLLKKQTETSKDMLELVRLRGELTTLKQQAAETARIKSENAQLRQLQSQAQAAQPAAAQPAVILPAAPQPLSASQAAQTCMANLKQLDGAKQQWALENKKSANDMPSFQDLIGTNKYIMNMPVCPAGGQYTLNNMIQPPQCSIEAHKIGQ